MRQSDADAATARLIIRYGEKGGTIVSATRIAARPPRAQFTAEPDSDGVWLVVRDGGGAVVQSVPLPDPRHGHEAIDADGSFGRAGPDASAERTQLIEVAYPAGATFELHVSGRPIPRRRGGRMGLSAGRRQSLVASGAIAAGAGANVADAGLVEHPGAGAANPHAKILLFLPDGFTAAEMPAFHAAVDRVATALLATEPFRSRADTLHVAHVDIPSRDSGIVGKSPRDTAFRGRFTVDRVIEADQALAAAALERFCGRRSAVALICANTLEYGGSGGAATVFSCHPDWMSEIAIHELGHGWFGLADEYTAGGQSATPKPVEPNVSGSAEREQLKWASHVAPGTPLPTLTDQPAGVVGAFEGAKYQATGVFRPAFDCKMRTPGVKFCPVCAAVIDAELDRHAP